MQGFGQYLRDILHEQRNEPFFSALAPHPLSFSGVPTFYLLLPSAPMHSHLDPEHEEQILNNIKKIIEYMYSSVGLPEKRSMRDTADDPTPTPEELGLDIKQLEKVKKLVEQGVFSEFPE